MARFRDEDDDYAPPPRRTGGNGLVIGILVGVGAVLLLGVAACAGVFFIGMRGVQQVADEAEARQEKARQAKEAALPTREQFESKWLGKNKNDVLAGLGKPKSTDKSGGREFWEYLGLTRDAVTGKTDLDTTLWFTEDGKVSRITH